MACPAVQTGTSFLASALGHIDCQSQTIGSYGWAALADLSSPTSEALAGLLTIFIAIFAFRLLLRYPIAGRDVVMDILRIAIVLTLATSWPAWRVLGYELIIEGPGQLAHTIGQGAGLPGSGGDLAARLQNADDGLAALNAFGSGRFGVAQGDWFQLGFARSAFLVGSLGPLALVRLSAGILLAVAPLLAGLLLFDVGRPIFEGWARALVFAFLASIMLTLMLGAELALIEPWLFDALRKRAADQPTLDAPVEILAATFSFALVTFGSVVVAARVAFHASTSRIVQLFQNRSSSEMPAARPALRAAVTGHDVEPARAALVSEAVSENMRREERITQIMRADGSRMIDGPAPPTPTGTRTGDTGALGGSWRRSARRVSSAGTRRDREPRIP